MFSFGRTMTENPAPTQNKMQEIYNQLDAIEKSYNPACPEYKFSHVFYSIVNGPVERPQAFPVELWNKYYIPNSNLMPVLLNREQLEERKVHQNDLSTKLQESKGAILKRIDSLKTKREMVRNKLDSVVLKFRKHISKKVYGQPIEGLNKIHKLQTEILEREKMGVRENKEEILSYLTQMNLKLVRFEKKVSQAIQTAERRISHSK